jgi:hypothetical protein
MRNQVLNELATYRSPSLASRGMYGLNPEVCVQIMGCVASTPDEEPCPLANLFYLSCVPLMLVN